MYSPPLLTLIITLLGVSSSSSTSASPAPIPSSSTPSTSSSKVYNTDYSKLASQFTRDDELVVFPGGGFEAGCTFVARGRAYELCPLLHTERVVKPDSTRDDGSDLRVKGKGKGKALDDINLFLGGWGRATESVPDSCPEEAHTCFIAREASQIRVTSIGSRLDPPSTPMVFARNFAVDGGTFELWHENKKESVRLILSCAGDDEVEYGETSEDVRTLRWRTPHACPVGSMDGLAVAEAEDDQPAADEEESELRNGGLPMTRVSRGWMSLMVVLIASTLIMAVILLSSPRARHYVLAHLQSAGYAILPRLSNLKQLTTPVAKHFPAFNVGERRLVRWAQEDMTLNGDEDFMINGENAEPHGWSDLEVMDEYIPLKSSPVLYAHGKKAIGSPSPHVVSASWSYSTYGSVPFEGLDVDESEVDMPPTSEGRVKRFICSVSEVASTKVKGLLRR